MDLGPRIQELAPADVVELLFRYLFLELNSLLLLLVHAYDEINVMLLAGIVLGQFKFEGLGFLMLAHQNALLNFCLLDIAFLAHLLNTLFVHLRDHLVVLQLLQFLLHLLVVALFKPHNFSGSFLRLLNFLPCFHFFLLQQRNAVCKQLGVSLNSK